MIKTTLLAGITILSLGIFSCQSPTTSSNTAAAQAATDSTSTVQKPNPHGGGGQPVPNNEIALCTAAYQKTMAEYGITVDSPSKPITKCPSMTYRTTLTENLTMTTFRQWLDSSVNAMDPNGKGANLNLTIVPGICTDQFVADMGQSKSRVGRISWFVMVTKIDTTGTAARPAGSVPPPPGGGGGGYEIGGIEP